MIGGRAGLWVSCFSMLSFCPFLFLGSCPFPAGSKSGEIRGWGVYTDLGHPVQLQARPTQSSVDKPKSLLFLLMCRRRVGEDKDNEEDTQRKTIQEYLALSDCE